MERSILRLNTSLLKNGVYFKFFQRCNVLVKADSVKKIYNVTRNENAPFWKSALFLCIIWENGKRSETTLIKSNWTWKIRSLAGYSIASHCTTDHLQVSLRIVTYCHGVLRSASFITTHYNSHFRHDCRGRFLNCQKNWHGVHGYHDLLRLPIPFPCVASCLSCFDHGRLKRGCHDRQEHSVNAT